MDVAGCSLAELTDDLLIGLIMRSDGVDRRELKLLLERASRTAIAGARFSETPVDHQDNAGSGPPISLEVVTEVLRSTAGASRLKNTTTLTYATAPRHGAPRRTRSRR